MNENKDIISNIKSINKLSDKVKSDNEQDEIKKLLPKSFRADIRKSGDDWYVILSYENGTCSIDIGVASDIRYKIEKIKDKKVKVKNIGLIGTVQLSTKKIGKLSLFVGIGKYRDVKTHEEFSSSFALIMGIPFFLGTTLTVGAGKNRDFILPDFDDLDSFPLLPIRKVKPPAEFEQTQIIKALKENDEEEEYIKRQNKAIADRAKEERDKIDRLEEMEIDNINSKYDRKIHNDPDKEKYYERKREEELNKERNNNASHRLDIDENEKKSLKEVENRKKQRKIDRDRGEDIDKIFEQLQAIKSTFPPKNHLNWGAIGLEGRAGSFVLSFLIAINWDRTGVTKVGGIGNMAFNVPTKFKNSKSKFANLNIAVVISHDFRKEITKIIGKLTDNSFLIHKSIKLSAGCVVIHNKDGWFYNIGTPIPSFGSNNLKPTPFKLSFKWKKSWIDIALKADAYLILNPALRGFGLHGKLFLNIDKKKFYLDIVVSAGIDCLWSYNPDVFKMKMKAGVGITLQVRSGIFSVRVHTSVGFSNQKWRYKDKSYYKTKFELLIWTIKVFDDDFPKIPKDESFANVKNLLPVYEVEESTTKKKSDPKKLSDEPVKLRNFANVTIDRGELKAYPEDKKEKKLVWIIDPLKFIISTSTTIPTNHANVLEQEVTHETAFVKKVNIKPHQPDHPNLDLYNKFKKSILSSDNEPTFLQRPNCTTNKANTPFLTENRTQEDQWIGISPMNKRIDSIHRVGMYHYPTKKIDGVPKKEPVNRLLVQLKMGSFPRKWFGSKALDIDQPSNNKFKSPSIENALSGVSLLPKPFFPARTQSINWYWLVFSPGNSMGVGPNDLPNVKNPIHTAEKVKKLEDVSIDTSSAIELLQSLDKDLFKGLSFRGNKESKISYWDRPLACNLAEEVNQKIKNRGY